MDKNNSASNDYVLEEMKKIIKKQYSLIVKQNNMISRMMNDYRLLRILSYVLLGVSAIVFALVPAGYLVYDGMREFLASPSWWGGILIAALLFFVVLAIVLVGMLRRRGVEYEEVIEVEEDEDADSDEG